MSKNKKKHKMKYGKPVVRDRHLLYSAAVQSVDADLDFFARIFRRMSGRPMKTLREDFCGTAALACEWVRRGQDHRAWGIDLDGPTLDWGRQRYVPRLGPAAKRLKLIRRNVLEEPEGRVDVTAALNFSFCVFKTRSELLRYFRTARRGLKADGIFFLDIFGGTTAVCEESEKRRISSSDAFDGTKVPAFNYIWDQASYNVIDHHIVCHIHFKLTNGEKIRRAFTYDWRLWTLPELQELLLEAGFEQAEVYLEGWDEEADDTDGVFRRRKRYENQEGWVAYVVGIN
jgi:SAM-dependent methyltransferase